MVRQQHLSRYSLPPVSCWRGKLKVSQVEGLMPLKVADVGASAAEGGRVREQGGGGDPYDTAV